MVPFEYRQAAIPGLEALVCRSEQAFAKHLHHGYVIWLNAGCAEQFEYAGCQDILPLGSVSVIAPGVVHANAPYGSEQRELRSLYLDPPFFSFLAEAFAASGGHLPSLGNQVFSQLSLWQGLAWLHQAVMEEVSLLEIEERIVEVFALFYQENVPETSRPAAIHNDQRRIRLVCRYMQDNLQQALPLHELAQQAGCSAVHLNRLFQAHVGLAPHAYLLQLRLERSRHLLGQERALADIAWLTGFADQSHFTRTFKARYGVSPGMYRRQCR